MDELIDTGQWVEMAYNGRNSYPITYSGYMRRKYRVSVRPDGTIRQTGTAVQDKTTVLVHPEDVRKLARVVEKRQPLFTLVQQTAVSQTAETGEAGGQAKTTAPDPVGGDGVRADSVGARASVGAQTPEPVTANPNPVRAVPEADDAPLNDLTVISGIGEKTAVKLNEAGIHSLTDLVAADSENLAATIGVNVSTVRGWQVDGRKLLAK